MNAFVILIIIALLLNIAALIWPNAYLTSVAGVLVCTALLAGHYISGFGPK